MNSHVGSELPRNLLVIGLIQKGVDHTNMEERKEVPKYT